MFRTAVMKKSLAAAALLLAFSCLSCGKQAGTEPNTAEKTGDSESVPVTEAETAPAFIDHLPDTLDFGGYQLRMLGDSSLYVREETGIAIDDAFYRQNRQIEERLNCTVEKVGFEGSAQDVMVKLVTNSVRAGSDDFDALAGIMWWATPLGLNGSLYNLRDAPYIEIDAPWWAADYIRGLSYHGDYYWLAGPIDISWNGQKSCVYVNTNLWNTLYDEDIYGIVDEGRWTIDTMKTIAEETYQDINGNGTYDPDDRLGYLTVPASAVEVFAYAAGVQIAPFDENGEPHLAFIEDPDRLVTFWEKIWPLKSDKRFCMELKSDDGADTTTQTLRVFSAGNVLFVNTIVAQSTYRTLREMKDDYGILPMPKLDEAQEKYITVLWDSVRLYALPTTVSDGGRDAALAFMEAAAAESYHTIVPLYLETNLKNKYIRDQRSVDIINMMSENPICDFGAQYLDLGFSSFLRYDVTTPAIASKIEKSAKKFRNKLDKMLEQLKDS